MTKPLQVYLDDDDLARLDAWSRERGWTKSEAVRLAIRALTHRPSADPLLAMSGFITDGLPEDVSENFDRYLNGTYVAETTPRYRRRTGPRKNLRR
jgi:hypothetical protein